MLANEAGTRRPRDPRLDFFRGLGMFIILIAHIPGNSWADWIPARFGFSDAADLFVFCSGMASAIAFGAVFDRRGWLMGAARILHRSWQVYWAHVGSFVVVVTLAVFADRWLDGVDYVNERLNLQAFFADMPANLARFATLTFIPDYFDILPMYLVLLAMIPLVMALYRVAPPLAALFVIACWSAANIWHVNFTGRPATGAGWYFNPLGWQIIFFTGFAFVRGWLPAPPLDNRLLAACVALVVVGAPLSCQHAFACYPETGAPSALAAPHEWLQSFADKTSYGPLRYVHFLATAYIAYALAGPFGARLRGRGVHLMRRVGQQTLAVFLVGVAMSQVCGALLDVFGRGPVETAVVNIVGALSLVATAYVVGWFKSSPWRAHKPPTAAPIEEKTRLAA